MSRLDTLRDEISICEREILGLYDLEFHSKNPKWEYRVLRNIDQDAMNGLGEQGFELVSAVSFSVGGGLTLNGSGSEKYVVHVEYTFKRKLVELSKELYEKRRSLDRLKQEFDIEMQSLNMMRNQGLAQFADGYMVMLGAPHGSKWKYRLDSTGCVEILNPMGGLSKCESIDAAKSTYTWWTNPPE